jgi:phosphomannomutase
MARSGVAFGTSGARGLATAMTDSVCYAYAKGFLQYLESIGEIKRAASASPSAAISGPARAA